MRLFPLVGISIVAWLLIMLETYLFFDVIIPLGPPIHSIGVFTEVALLKLALTFGLGALWFFVIISLTQLYARSRKRSQTPSASS